MKIVVTIPAKESLKDIHDYYKENASIRIADKIKSGIAKKLKFIALHPLTGHGAMVFPGERSHERPISDNTLRAALLTLGSGPTVQSVHGFRATARTILAEVLEFDPLVIEAQLAHAVKDTNGRAYNRTTFLKQRADMMQRWCDFLDKLAAGADVIEFRPKAA